MVVASIPGFNVHKIGKNQYAVAVNNGNMGAVVVNKNQLKMMADMYGGEVKDGSKTKKVLGGLLLAGAAAAAVVYRKNIGEFVKGLKNGKVSELADGVKAKAADAAETAKTKAGKWYNNVADWAVEGWNKIKNFFKGIFGKKVNDPQLELPFPKENKPGFFEKAGNWFKLAARKVKNFFSSKEKGKTVFGKIKNEEMQAVRDSALADYAKSINRRPSGKNILQVQSDLNAAYGKKNVELVPQISSYVE